MISDDSKNENKASYLVDLLDKDFYSSLSPVALYLNLPEEERKLLIKDFMLTREDTE